MNNNLDPKSAEFPVEKIKEVIAESHQLLKDFLYKVVQLRLKHGSLSTWLDSLTNISELKLALAKSSDADLGSFFRLYMDYTYLAIIARNFNNLDTSEIEVFGETIGLNADEISNFQSISTKWQAYKENSEES